MTFLSRKGVYIFFCLLKNNEHWIVIEPTPDGCDTNAYELRGGHTATKYIQNFA